MLTENWKKLQENTERDIGDMAERLTRIALERDEAFIKVHVESIIKQVLKSGDIEVIRSEDNSIIDVRYHPYLGANVLRAQNRELKARLDAVRAALNSISEV